MGIAWEGLSFCALSASYLNSCNRVLQKGTNLLLSEDTKAWQTGDTVVVPVDLESLVGTCFPSKWTEIIAPYQNSGKLSAIMGISNPGVARFKKKIIKKKYCSVIQGNRFRERTFESQMWLTAFEILFFLF